MNIAVLGTGVVGRTLSARLVSTGQAVVMGTRDPAELMARGGDERTEAFSDWHTRHAAVKVATFADAAAQADIVVNATAGMASLRVLESAGAHNLAGKVLIDVANALDVSQGMPPTLAVANTDSLGEQIQRAFPETRVVKTLNTVNASVMADPGALANGDHHVFLSGNDAAAKETVARILREQFGWRHIIDLGDITTARGAEMVFALWVRLMGALGTPRFNYRIVT